MSATFSTFRQEVASGRVFSSHLSDAPHSRDIQPNPRTFQPTVPTALALEIPLENRSLVGGPFQLPDGFGNAAGRVRIQGESIAAEVHGLPGGPPQGNNLTLWLLKDLTVPADLDPRDLALLPHGSDGTANQPGAIFTLDGRAPGIGASVNTVALAVSPGHLGVEPIGTGRLGAPLAPVSNLTFDPRILAGYPVDPTAYLPSGLAHRILTDLFLHQATVLPEIPVRTHFGQRLLALLQRDIAALDRNGDGKVTLDEVQESEDAFLPPDQFNRAAVTLEPLIKPVPLMPTQSACILIGSRK